MASATIAKVEIEGQKEKEKEKEEWNVSVEARRKVLTSLLLDIVPGNICCFLPVHDIRRLGSTCRALYIAVETPVVWKTLLRNDFQFAVDELEKTHDKWSRLVYDREKKRYAPTVNSSSPTGVGGNERIPSTPTRSRVPRMPSGSPIAPRNLSCEFDDAMESVRRGSPRSAALGAGFSRTGSRGDMHAIPLIAPPTVAEVASLPFHDWKEPYSWKDLYQFVYAGRVGNWRRQLSTKKGMATLQLMNPLKQDDALQTLSSCLEWQWQGGLVGGIESVTNDFAVDLLERADVYYDRNEVDKAFMDYAMATLVAPEKAALRSKASLILDTLATEQVVNDKAKILSSNFNFEQSYDEVLLSGTMFDRAAFLHKVSHWKGHSFETRLHQYLLCDLLKFWPERLIIDARCLARTKTQRGIAEAWLAFDRHQPALAIEHAEKAIAALPEELRVAVQKPVTNPPILPEHIEPLDRKALPAELAEIVPEMAFAFFTLAFVANFTEEAITHYCNHLRCAPQRGRLAVACNNIGSLYYQRSEYEAALKWLGHSKSNNPRYFMTYKNIAKCYGRLDNRRAALDELNKAKQHCTPAPAELFSERSKYIPNPGQDLAMASRLCPRLSYPYRFRSAVAMDSNDATKALAELDTIIAMTLEPADLALRADFKKELGMTSLALDDMILAATLVPTATEYRKWIVNTVTEAMMSESVWRPLSMDGPFGRASDSDISYKVEPPHAPKVGMAFASQHRVDPDFLAELDCIIATFYPKGTPPRVASSQYAVAHLQREVVNRERFIAGYTTLSRQEAAVLATELVHQLQRRRSRSEAGLSEWSSDVDDELAQSDDSESADGTSPPQSVTPSPTRFGVVRPTPRSRNREGGMSTEGSPMEETPAPRSRPGTFRKRFRNIRKSRDQYPNSKSFFFFWRSQLPLLIEKEVTGSTASWRSTHGQLGQNHASSSVSGPDRFRHEAIIEPAMGSANPSSSSVEV
jgi:tetratricopeptide (TPR) repeat protein